MAVIPWFSGRADVKLRMGFGPSPVVYRVATLLSGRVSDGSVRIMDSFDDTAAPVHAQILTVPGTPSAAAVGKSMRDMPLRGVLSRLPDDGPGGPLYLLLAPTLLDAEDCSAVSPLRTSLSSSAVSPPADDGGVQPSTPGGTVSCSLGGEQLIFPSAAAAGRALEVELALSAARHIASPEGAGALLPRSLLKTAGVATLEQAVSLATAQAHVRVKRQRQRRLLQRGGASADVPLLYEMAALQHTQSSAGNQAAPGAKDAAAAAAASADAASTTSDNMLSAAPRRAFISSTTSRGARSLLGIRVKFNGQADSAATTAADAAAILWNSTSVLNRAAMGAGNGATFAWSLAQGLHALPASFLQCSSDTDGMASSAIALARAADPSLNTSAYQHFVVFLPSCGYPWAGLADTPGSNSWMNGLSAGADLDTSVLVLVHEIGHNVSARGGCPLLNRCVRLRAPAVRRDCVALLTSQLLPSSVS